MSSEESAIYETLNFYYKEVSHPLECETSFFHFMLILLILQSAIL